MAALTDTSLFFDIDGTLTCFDTGQIPSSAVAALTELRERGAHLFIASGRSRPVMVNIGSIEHLMEGFICANGACTWHKGRLLEQLPLPREYARALLADAREHGYICNITSHEHYGIFNYSPQNGDPFIRSLEEQGVDWRYSPERIVEEEEVLQITSFVGPDYEGRLHELAPGCLTARWHPAFIDITAPGADKGQALLRLLEQLQLPVERSYAFGDGGNDMGMLKAAGTGVAMGNASDGVKACAAWVTASSGEDGLLMALQHFGLL
ncbi:MAG: Cof-type HAD-IIB family hydrolase [Succinivibrio sp.]|nr:Cof-type HAD-IIB family hydrolase [Succinivibrio sp.]